LKKDIGEGGAVFCIMLAVDSIPEIAEKYSIIDCDGEIDTVKIVSRTDRMSPRVPDLTKVWELTAAPKKFVKFLLAYNTFLGWGAWIVFSIWMKCRGVEQNQIEIACLVLIFVG